MIRKITFSNFYSFSKKCSLDFTIHSRAPQNPSYFKTCDHRRLSTVYTVIGPNASGKTNLLRALAFSSWFAKYSYQRQPTINTELPYKSFILQSKPNLDGKISLEIESEGTIYQYDFSFSKNLVHSESLKQIYPLKKLIFSRYQYPQQSKYNLKNLGVSEELIKSQIKPNASLLSLALSLPKSNVKKLVDAFETFTNVKEIGHTDPSSILNSTLRVLEEQPQKKSRIISLINQHDINLSDISINSDSNGNYVNSSFGIHQIKKSSRFVQIPLIYESTGTKYLLSIFRYIDDALAGGVNAVIDEIDNNLHPLILPHIIDLFVNPQTNPHHAQLIISTHNSELLNYLDKQQIIIVEKDILGSSHAFKLSQISGVKESDNLVKKYLSGNYGGIPNL